jgi:DNA mismatch endonuclease (patch repair protein)
MSRIKGKDTRPEMVVRRYLFANGFRYRLHDKRLPGKPDVVLAKYKTAIFVNGCFWHGHEGCKFFVMPKTRVRWWEEKIRITITKDKESIRELKLLGWYSIVVWECELKKDKRKVTLENIRGKLDKQV